MKKAISLLLAALLLVSLMAMVGCSNETEAQPDSTTPAGDSTTTPAAPDASTPDASAPADGGALTKEQLEASLPYEYIQEKLAAGIPVSLQYSAFVDNEMMMVMFADAVEEVCKEYGITFTKVHAGGDVSNQISQLENFITMDTNIIFAAPPDGSLVKETVQKAQDAGIAVIVYGCPDASYAVSTFADQWTKGYMTAEMMYAYFNSQNPNAAPGSEKVALLVTKAIPPMQQQYQGIIDSINSHEEFVIAYEFDGIEDVISSGFDATQNALTFDPSIRYILCQTQIPVVGVCNYIASIPGVDVNEYAVFTSNEDETTIELEQMTLQGQSCLRGTITADRTDAEYIKEVTEMVVNNETFKEYTLMFKLAAIPVGWDFDYNDQDVDMSLNPYLA